MRKDETLGLQVALTTLTNKVACPVATGQHGVVLLAGVGDGFQLESRQAAGVDHLFGQVQAVVDIRRLHAGQAAGLHHCVRVTHTDGH
jgi:hypothetical protein